MKKANKSANMVHIIHIQVRNMEKNLVISSGEVKIAVKVNTPDHGAARRIVLGVHGLGGSSEDDIQTGLAEEMGLFGAAMVRFDFPGHGDSPMDAFDLEDCCATLLGVAEFAKEEFPQVEDLCIFATGFGAYVTLLCLYELRQLPGKVKLVIQTPSVRMDRSLLRMIKRTEQTLRVEEQFTIPRERPLVVTYDFYQQLRMNVAMDSYDMPLLILRGEDDQFISAEDIQNFRRINEEAKLVTIPGASHQFLEPGAWDMVLDLTRDWFEYEQVLLSDWE